MNLLPIPGHDGYAASKDGRIYSLDRYAKRGNGTMRIKQRELSPKTTAQGYLTVKLMPLRKNSFQLVHRLVMLAFIEADPDRPHVNHINGVRTDNRLSNLEWINKSENALHAYRVLGSTRGATGNVGPIKPVIGRCNATGKEVSFNSMKSAINHGFTVSGISQCIRGVQKTHRGLVWKLSTGEQSGISK